MTTVYLAHYSGLRRGWFVLSHPARDRVALRTESGPYTTKAQAELKVRQLERESREHNTADCPVCTGRS